MPDASRLTSDICHLTSVTARIAELAYDDDPGDALKDELGYSLVRAYDRGGTQALLATDFHTVVLAFRGTAERADLFTDLKYAKCDFPAGGRVHRGFYVALKHVWDDIEADLKRLAWPKVFTGHSLGAALAVLAAVLHPPRETHVFGCPRVGNRDFARRVPSPLYRHENWFDPVPWIPLRNSPVQAWHALRRGRMPTLYAHAGRRVRSHAFGHPVSRYVGAAAKGGHQTINASIPASMPSQNRT